MVRELPWSYAAQFIESLLRVAEGRAREEAVAALNSVRCVQEENVRLKSELAEFVGITESYDRMARRFDTVMGGIADAAARTEAGVDAVRRSVHPAMLESWRVKSEIDKARADGYEEGFAQGFKEGAAYGKGHDAR